MLKTKLAFALSLSLLSFTPAAFADVMSIECGTGVSADDGIVKHSIFVFGGEQGERSVHDWGVTIKGVSIDQAQAKVKGVKIKQKNGNILISTRQTNARGESVHTDYFLDQIEEPKARLTVHIYGGPKNGTVRTYQCVYATD